MDKPRIEAAVRELLLAIGEDPDREGLRDTPRRVANMYGEIFGGMEEDPRSHLKIFTEEQNDEMVTVRDIPRIPCASTHLFPSWGWHTSRISPGTGGSSAFLSWRGLSIALPVGLSSRSGLPPR